MSNIKAYWDISLMVSCPQCGHDYDLVHTDDFWYGIEAVEHGTPETTDFECCCPECDHEFTCDFIY